MFSLLMYFNPNLIQQTLTYYTTRQNTNLNKVISAPKSTIQ